MEIANLILTAAAVVGIAILFVLVKYHLPSYVAEKGKNLATKEDIAGITNEVERVRHEYATKIEILSFQNQQILSHVNRKHQLRMAALDKRLEVHQQAYWQWVKLLRTVHEPKLVYEAAAEAQEWWMKNGLYLEPEVRQAFRVAYMTATDHHRLLQDRGVVALINESWKGISQVGEVITRAMELPAIADEEKQIPKRSNEV